MSYHGFQYDNTEWTLWDKIEFEGNPNLKAITNWFQEKHSLDVNMVSQGVSMLWSQFMPKKKVCTD